MDILHESRNTESYADAGISTVENTSGGATLFATEKAEVIEHNDELYYSGEYVRKQKLLSAEKLYPDRSSMSPELSTAFDLLKKAEENAVEAKKSLRNNDKVGSDNATIHLEYILAELFCCTKMHDGFRSVVNALYHSLQNRDQGALIPEKQITKIYKAIKKIHNEPFLSFSSGLSLIMELEDTGLNVDPEHMDHFMELVDG